MNIGVIIKKTIPIISVAVIALVATYFIKKKKDYNIVKIYIYSGLITFIIVAALVILIVVVLWIVIERYYVNHRKH